MRTEERERAFDGASELQSRFKQWSAIERCLCSRSNALGPMAELMCSFGVVSRGTWSVAALRSKMEAVAKPWV
jgi:hypothetical protein